jgi:hypothetical protein
MKLKIFIMIAALFILTSGNLFSQKAKSPGMDYSRIYDISSVETIVGQIRSIDKIYPSNNSSYGTHMSVFTSAGDITVHLGPGWFIDSQVLQLRVDDNVVVIGSKVTYEGNQVIIAREVTKGDQVLKLRDDLGYPLWAGQRVK